MIRRYLSSLLFLLSFNTASPQAMQYDPDLWLPDTIFLALGNTIELYNDNAAFVRLNDNTLTFAWSYTKGSSDSKKYYWTADQIGNVKIKLICFFNSTAVDSVKSIIKVVNKSEIEAKNLLTIGNSLTALGYDYQIPKILSDINFEINTIGTEGTIYKHEAHPGWTFQSFLSSISPFYIQNKIDFKSYIGENDLPDPEIIRISLGINDCYGSTLMNNIVQNAYDLINEVSSDYPNSLIIVALPTICESTGSGWLASYGDMSNFEPYILRIRELWKRLYNIYSYGKYKSHIQLSYDGLVIDRKNGYPTDNAVHPNYLGYTQLIRGFSNTLNYYVKRTLTSVNDHEADQNLFKIFPNPAHENVEIVFENELPERVFLYNLTGQLVLSQQVNDQNVVVNTSHLAPGIYICTINLGRRTYSRIISKL